MRQRLCFRRYDPYNHGESRKGRSDTGKSRGAGAWYGVLTCQYRFQNGAPPAAEKYEKAPGHWPGAFGRALDLLIVARFKQDDEPLLGRKQDDALAL